jgi:hypothetical protein
VSQIYAGRVTEYREMVYRNEWMLVVRRPDLPRFRARANPRDAKQSSFQIQSLFSRQVAHQLRLDLSGETHIYDFIVGAREREMEVTFTAHDLHMDARSSIRLQNYVKVTTASTQERRFDGGTIFLFVVFSYSLR